jgi:hypothetical protein
MTRRKKLSFRGADADDDSLVRAVIAGRKTVTADTVEDYYKGYGELDAAPPHPPAWVRSLALASNQAR